MLGSADMAMSNAPVNLSAFQQMLTGKYNALKSEIPNALALLDDRLSDIKTDRPLMVRRFAAALKSLF